jgi:hypothetical protein
MSIPASAENTMKILKVKDDNYENNSDDNDNNWENSENNSENNSDKNKNSEDEDKIFFKRTLNDSDDDMVVIILEEEADIHLNNKVEVQVEEKHETEKETSEPENEDDGGSDTDGNNDDNDGDDHATKNEKIITPKQKYIGSEVYTHLQQTLESQKLYPLLPCNMISSFARVMEYVEYFDIPSEDRRKLVIDLVKILAYSNNDHGSRECFEYFAEHNMIDDIIKTIIDGTKNRYDINRFPHTNRKIVLSCVSLSNKIKIAKPNAKIESLFEEFKLNLCGLKRFFKPRDKEESKQT